MITKNVGSADRIIRIIAGLALAYAAYMSDRALSLVLAAAALIALGTGLFGWCGLYAVFGIKTCKIDKP